MTGQVSEPAATTHTPQECPACGRFVQIPIDGRCSFCGERMQDGDVTSDDHTPYASALAAGTSGYWSMCRWVFAAGKSRLAHLGLSRPSRASRRFARLTLLLVAFAATFSVFANSGWREVRDAKQAAMHPVGKGWWQTFDIGEADAAPNAVRALWWNPAWATVSGAAAFVIVLLIGPIIIGLTGRGAQRALRGKARGTPRLRCAVHYSTAWMHLPALGAIVLILVPLVRLADLRDWVHVPLVVVHMPAVLLAVLGLLLWWLWCMRLGQTMPPDSRTQAVRYFLINAPLWSAVLITGTVYGWWYGADYVMRALHLDW